MLGNLIVGFIVIVVGTALTPTVANQVYASRFIDAANSTNITGAASTIIGLTTLFFALAVAGTSISISLAGLKNVM